MAACSARPAPPPASHQAPAPAAPAAAASAGWHYHPRTPAELRARITLQDGTWLFAGDAGERWVADPGAGTASSASMLADEDLVAILRPSAGGFVFVGNSGTLYAAPEPLAPFSEVKRPARRMTRMAAAGSTLLGVREDGALLRSLDTGNTFLPAAFAGGRVADLAVASDGRAVVLSVPERLWESTDAGATFKLSGARNVGAMSAGLDAAGDPVVTGVLRSLAWRSGSSGLQPLRGPVEAPEYDLMTEPKPGPSGLALATGAAALDGTQYVEAVAPRKKGGLWTLISSQLLGRATRESVISGSSDCTRMLVSTRGRWVVLGCLAGSGSERGMVMPHLKLLVSTDGGVLFHSRGAGVVADERRARLRVLGSGTLLVTGACKPGARRTCQVAAPMRIPLLPGPSALRLGEVQEAEAPAVPVQAIGLEVSADEKTLYWAGRLAPSRQFAMLVSQDQGETFKPVPWEVERLGLGTAEEASALLDSAQPDALGMDEQGNVSVTLTTSKGALWMIFDRQGRAVSGRIVAQELPMLAAAGRRGLGFGGPDSRLQMSNDGGGSFEPLGAMPESVYVVEGQPAIFCGAAGCAMGTSFSWQGWTKVPGGSLANSSSKSGPPKLSLLTPIVCRSSGPWHTLSRVEGLPIATTADRAGAAWTVIVRGERRGEVSFAVARAGPPARVELLRVLEPATGRDVAMKLSAQAEGMAALRYSIERDSDGEIRFGRPLRNVEVGWVNLFQGGVKRGKLAESGVLQPDDAGGYGGDAYAAASILSVAPDGIFVCPHASCDGSDKLAAFIDLQGRARPLAIPAWPAMQYQGERLTAHIDMLRVEGRDVPIAFESGGVIMGRAHPGEDGSLFEAMSLAAASDVASGYRVKSSWIVGDKPQAILLGVTMVHPTRPAGYANMLQFRARDQGVATLLPAPVLSDAGDPPRACTAADRKDGPRFLAPVSGGRRHPILVESQDGEPVWLLSDDAVMWGKPGSGCVSMLDSAFGVEEAASTRVLVDLVHPGSSWIFEVEREDAGRALQWRTATCSFDPSRKAPESLADPPEGQSVNP